MRILHVLPSINPVTGGPPNSVMLESRALVRIGHTVEILTTSWPDSSRDSSIREYDDGGVTVRVFPNAPLWPLRHVPHSRVLLDYLAQQIGRFDFYVASSLWNPIATFSMALYRRHQVPYGIFLHGMLDPVVFRRHGLGKTLWAKMWERRNVEEASILRFTSEPERNKAQNCGWKIRNSCVVPILVDLTAGLNLPVPTQLEVEYPQIVAKEVIAFVGRINWVKNLPLLINALSQLRQRGRDVVLLCVGPDSDGHRAILERQAEELSVGSQIVFTGLRSVDALKAVYARADVVALVSQKENFGLAAAEALCAGVPLVLSDGVDMGHHWTAPPVWRVAPNANSVTEGLEAALAYSRNVVKPCQAAQSLAAAEWGDSKVAYLSSHYEAAAGITKVKKVKAD
jgi:glycosyltransferase involved in cell wall biosynthesis